MSTNVPANLPSKTTTLPGLGLELSALIGSGMIEDAARAVVADGRVEELREALPRIAEEAKRGGGVQGVYDAIFPWFATYPQPQRTDAEWEEFWRGYNTVCGHLPTDALKAAMKDWAAKPDSDFLPKPGKLRELAQSVPTPGFRLYNRGHRILEHAERLTGQQRVALDMSERKVTSPEQAAEILHLLGDYQRVSAPVRERAKRIVDRGWKAAEQPDADLPYSGGIPAPGSSLTAAMLKSLGRPLPTPPVDADGFSEDMG